MRRSPIRVTWFAILPLVALCAAAQDATTPPPTSAEEVVVPASQTAALAQPPVAYASLNQLNALLGQLEQSSQAAQLDLAKLRVERWKADSGSKRQAQTNVDSIQRNLQTALPQIIGELRASPENLQSTFKLYRNLDALYSVFGNVVESAGAFGSRDDFQSLQNDMTALEQSRRAFADRMENLSGAKEAELARLRSDVHTLQASKPATAPKKIIVDDDETPKKPVKKKSTAKTTKPATTTPPSTPTPR